MKMSRLLKSSNRRLRYESLEDRRMLATISVTFPDDPVIPTSGTLRQAFALANFLAGPDEIVIDDDLAGQTINLTQGTLVANDRVIIRGPVVDNPMPGEPPLRVTLSNGGLSTQTAIQFSGFNQKVSGEIDSEQGVENLRIEDFGTAIHVTSISTNYDEDTFFVVDGNILVNNDTSVLIENSDLLYRIQNNVIFGSGGSGSGVRLNNVDQTVVNPFFPQLHSMIGGSGNANFIGNHGSGIRVNSSFQPDLQITDNRIGADGAGTQVPNGKGIWIDGSPTNDPTFGDIGRIIDNDIVFNNGEGILIQFNDRIVIEDNLIGGNLGHGIALENASESHVIRNNTFDTNTGDGIRIVAVGAGDNSSGVEITENDFLGMAPGAQPIDLGGDGPTANDLFDIDGITDGPNRLLNYAVVDDVNVTLTGGTWNVPIDFDPLENVNYRLEFYRFDATLQNYTHIRSETVSVSETLSQTFSFANGSELSAGDRLSVVAVQVGGIGDGDTSELSFASLSEELDPPPTITDVRLSGTGWMGLGPYSFSSIVADGEQLRPIFTEGVNTIEIVFSEDVTFGDNGDELQLKGKNNNDITGITFGGFNDTTNTATWTLANPLPLDKYAIHLSDLTITDAGGQRLDSEWTNDVGVDVLGKPSPDDWTDDPSKSFTEDMGNGVQGSDANEFRFHFAYLPGDSDGNGIVETDPSGADDDLQVGVLGDIDGDGVPGTAADGTAAELLDGNMLPLRSIGGADLNDDEIVDGEDLAIWETGYGGNMVGDVNGDGVANGLDFLAWQIAFGTFSAWYTGTIYAGTGGTLPLFLIGTAPQVENVTISGSLSVHDPFEFDSFDGSGIQLQTVPVGGADTISITFSELVNISADSLAIVGLHTANLPVLAEFSYDAMTMTATWRFEGWALGDQYLLSLHDSVTDIEGNLLDGEWVNPASITTVDAAVSEFPSGDGTAGGHFNFVMTLLPGDVNLDGIVGASDLAILNGNWSPVEIDKMFIDGDFNGDGAVGPADLGVLSINWHTNLQDIFVLADLDGDFDVDDDDLQTISDNFGMTGATYADGDLNGDGIIDDADLDLAFAQFSLAFDWVA